MLKQRGSAWPRHGQGPGPLLALFLSLKIQAPATHKAVVVYLEGYKAPQDGWLLTNASYSHMAPTRPSTFAASPSSTNEHIPRDPGFRHANLPYQTNAPSQSSTSEVPPSRADEHIPRPPNSWILFRKATLAQMRNTPAFQAADAGKHRQADISRMIAALWRTAPADVKAKFTQMAELEKLKHAEKYSDYKFKPKRKAIKSTGRSGQRVEKEGYSPAFCPIGPTSFVACDPGPISPPHQWAPVYSSTTDDRPIYLPSLPPSFQFNHHNQYNNHPQGLSGANTPLNAVYDTHGYPTDPYDVPLPDPLTDDQLDWFVQQLNSGALDPQLCQQSQHILAPARAPYMEPYMPQRAPADGPYSGLDFEPGGRYFIDLWRDGI